MIAEIIMNSSVRNLDKTFDYSIPIDMEYCNQMFYLNSLHYYSL